jgi:hypothetical protein
MTYQYIVKMDNRTAVKEVLNSNFLLTRTYYLSKYTSMYLLAQANTIYHICAGFFRLLASLSSLIATCYSNKKLQWYNRIVKYRQLVKMDNMTAVKVVFLSNVHPTHI